MVDDPTIYALQCQTAWVAWPDPGFYKVLDRALNTAGEADALVHYNFRSGVYEHNKNVKAGVIGGSNLLVSSTYTRIPEKVVGT